MGIAAIDPAHIAENGLAVKVAPKTVFEAWPMPTNIRMECACLEGPTFLHR
jgi:hypothetical protein